MKISSCSCLCGNVQIKGQLVLNDVDKDCFQFSKTCFAVQSQLIEIKNFNNIKKIVHNKTSMNVKCPQCGTSFRIFSYEKKFYIEKMQPSIVFNQKYHDIDALIPQNPKKYCNIYPFQNSNDINNCFVVHFLCLNDFFVFNDKEDIQFHPESNKTCSYDFNQKEKIAINKIINTNTNSSHFGNNKCNEDDTDFEIMFSNKYDPFIGSFNSI